MEPARYISFTVAQTVMLTLGQWSEAHGVTGYQSTIQIDADAWKDLQRRLGENFVVAVTALLADPLAQGAR